MAQKFTLTESFVVIDSLFGGGFLRLAWKGPRRLSGLLLMTAFKPIAFLLSFATIVAAHIEYFR